MSTWCRALACLLALAVLGDASFLSAPHAVFTYPDTARSERDLPPCSDRAVCSVLHKRFWGAPPMVERMCRCPGRMECPAKWTEAKDHHSMYLNTRAQLKFCKDVSKMKKCRAGGNSLTVTSRLMPPDRLSQTPATKVTVALATCVCPGPPAPRHWQHKAHHKRDFGNGTVELVDTFSCAKLTRCDAHEFCGNVRADHFSSYYRCSCLRGSLCVFSGYEQPRNVSELLFSGLAYKARCTPYPDVNKIH